jgi:peptidoglycan/xylan/chitin deacetylase (PgdA/CDA1 family)
MIHQSQSQPPPPAAAALGRWRARNDAFTFWKLSENWREPLRAGIGASEPLIEHYLWENYLPLKRRRPPAAMRAYYAVKQLIPERLRHRLNGMIVRSRRRAEFPAWPCESVLLEFWREWLRQSLATLGVSDGWHISFWPGGHDCCVVLTHDVEGPAGQRRMEAMADLEERYGFRSAWNLPLAQYPIDWNLVERLRARGFEFGAHGLSHDGKLFRSHDNFVRLAPELERRAREHGLRGFRAPSTLRRPEWIASMSFDFDSSFADTDPWEPQAGGTCAVFPFHLEHLVELPYTLPQDHTMLHLLRRSPLEVWITKLEWIAAVGGMILALVHPDYCGAGWQLAEYEELLKRLSALESSWRALPSEAADWWRRRAAFKLLVKDDKPLITGRNTAGAVARRLSTTRLAA